MWSATLDGKVLDSGEESSETVARQAALAALPTPEVEVTTKDIEPPQPPPVRQGPGLRWSYGVTTVPSRRDELLHKTLVSLKLAGFDQPRLFVDGSDDPRSWEREFGLEVSSRSPTVRAYGNWMLALWELYLRDCQADRYAIFQDDFVTYRNLRDYLESCEYPKRGYWNLYTFNSNHILTPLEGKYVGWFKSNQFGRGAVALVFDLLTVQTLLASRHMVDRVLDPKRGHCKIDGGIVEALKKEGWTEYVHNPSLTQHLGEVSAIGNPKHQQAPHFKGESFDARELLKVVTKS